ncbi:hypothetical protein EFW58_03823 [Bacillus velezensis]|nr:hypothetical protein EFW58_03823 [Bacillus velezensis]
MILHEFFNQPSFYKRRLLKTAVLSFSLETAFRFFGFQRSFSACIC